MPVAHLGTGLNHIGRSEAPRTPLADPGGQGRREAPPLSKGRRGTRLVCVRGARQNPHFPCVGQFRSTFLVCQVSIHIFRVWQNTIHIFICSRNAIHIFILSGGSKMWTGFLRVFRTSAIHIFSFENVDAFRRPIISMENVDPHFCLWNPLFASKMWIHILRRKCGSTFFGAPWVRR